MCAVESGSVINPSKEREKDKERKERDKRKEKTGRKSRPQYQIRKKRKEGNKKQVTQFDDKSVKGIENIRESERKILIETKRKKQRGWKKSET